MKKIVLSAVFSLFVTIILFAQKKNSLEFSFGPSFAVGAFGGRNLDNPKSGYAGAGQQVNVGYTYKLTKKFGLSALLYAQRNLINRNKLNDHFSGTNMGANFVFGTTTTVISTQPMNPPPPVYYTNWSIEKKAWLAASLLVGGTADLPFHETGKLSFIANGMIGLIAIKSPKIEATSETDTSATHFSQTSKSGFGFAYLLRAGLKYKLNSRIALQVAVDYMASSPVTFKKVQATETTVTMTTGSSFPTYSQATQTADAKQSLQAINLNAGIVLQL
ncbi:MAG: hypothetical protein QM764_03035 [Chitinophagaceae bacterium]